ncbi:ubiquitin-like protein Pup [Mobiluncus porci]|nr:ubiquitin-like protein Pup [Mobiluncus porci]
MMAKQIQESHSKRENESVEEVELAPQNKISEDKLDALIEDIEDILNVNALSFVQNFKQQGGQ